MLGCTLPWSVTTLDQRRVCPRCYPSPTPLAGAALSSIRPQITLRFLTSMASHDLKAPTLSRRSMPGLPPRFLDRWELLIFPTGLNAGYLKGINRAVPDVASGKTAYIQV